MNKITKVIITLIGVVLAATIDFLAFNVRLDFGPAQGSDGYMLNNSPANTVIRWIGLIVLLALLWYLLTLLIKSRKVAMILFIIALPLIAIGEVLLSIGLYGLFG